MSHVLTEPLPANTALSPTESADCPQPRVSSGCLRALAFALLVAGGSLALLPLWLDAYRLWSGDALRSIGMIFPVLALLGVLAAWRRLGWAAEGNWWGLPLVTLSIPLARFVSVARLAVIVHGERINLLHPGPVLFLYGTGATLLFGGPKLLRAGLPSLALLLAIDPVPHVFNAAIDLPMQHLSAATARSFAHLLGLQPTGEQLRMMFAPDFGMLIVPGCNGLRGAVTLAWLTLLFGSSRRLSPRLLALLTPTALLLGYGLNLLRLITLVLYYRLGLTFPSIQPYGESVDYAIGCSVFLLATLTLGMLIHLLKSSPAARTTRTLASTRFVPSPLALRLRAWSFLLLTSVFALPQLHSLATLPAPQPDEQHALETFSPTVGSFHLLRTYAEHDPNGNINLAMADYSDSASGRRLTLGLWVAAGNHLVASSKMAQGLTPLWTGSFEAVAASLTPIHFVTSLFDDGATRSLEAETACSAQDCSDQLARPAHGRFVFVAPKVLELALPARGKRLPILLERQWPENDATPPLLQQQQFEADARAFTQQLDLISLVERLGSRP